MSRSSFDVREFPQVRVANAGGPLAHEEMTALLRDEGGKPLARCAGPRAEVRELMHAALAMSGAKRDQRTNGAFGLPWCTHKRAEFHQGLVEAGAQWGNLFRVPCSVVCELWRRIQGKSMFFKRRRFKPCGGHYKLFRKLPKALIEVSLSGISFDTEQAREHSNDVAVQNGLGLIEGDAADGSGGIAANSRQGQHVFKVFREFASVTRKDGFRGFLHVTDTRVIAQSFPEFVNSLRAGSGEGFDIGQRSHPAMPKREDGFDLGLLEHDFGNPDSVRIMRATPGEIARIPDEPRKQQGRDCGEGF